jgi:hypothetical protein
VGGTLQPKHGAFAVAVVFVFFCCHPSPKAEDLLLLYHLLLLYQLLLPLQVFAVILSAAKDPEEANSPQPLEPFSPSLFRRCRCVALANRLCLLSQKRRTCLLFGLSAGLKTNPNYFSRFSRQNRMSSPQAT